MVVIFCRAVSRLEVRSLEREIWWRKKNATYAPSMNPALKDTNVANVACRTSKFKKQKQKQNMIGNGKKKTL